MKTKNVMLAFAIVAIASCKKDETAPSNASTVPVVLSAQDLIAKKWRQVSAIETYNFAPGSTEVFANSNECLKDNITIFNTNGVFSYTAGVLKCNTSEPDLLEGGTWSLTNNNTKLSYTAAGIPYLNDIVELTGTSLKLRYSNTIPPGVVTTTKAYVPVP
jgi:hypothetical protein